MQAPAGTPGTCGKAPIGARKPKPTTGNNGVAPQNGAKSRLIALHRAKRLGTQVIDRCLAHMTGYFV